MELYRSNPELREQIASVVATQRHAWIEATQRSALAKIKAEHESSKVERALLGPKSSALEKLLVERLVMAHLHVNMAEFNLASLGDDPDPEMLQLRQDVYDKAHRRYLSAIKTLAQVRRLELPPATRVNLANQQVNLLGVDSRNPQSHALPADPDRSLPTV